MRNIEKKFNEFIESGILDRNQFQEYEICISEFDSKEQEHLKEKNEN